MTIKKAIKNNIKEICQLLNNFQSIREYEGDDVEPNYIKGFIKNKNKFIFVIVEQDKIIGVTTGHIWKEGRYAEIIDLAIKENHQNKGIGKKLINHCIDYFKSKKLDYVLFHAKEDNIIMQKCAESIYKGRTDIKLNKGFKCIHYCVDL